MEAQEKIYNGLRAIYEPDWSNYVDAVKAVMEANGYRKPPDRPELREKIEDILLEQIGAKRTDLPEWFVYPDGYTREEKPNLLTDQILAFIPDKPLDRPETRPELRVIQNLILDFIKPYTKTNVGSILMSDIGKLAKQILALIEPPDRHELRGKIKNVVAYWIANERYGFGDIEESDWNNLTLCERQSIWQNAEGIIDQILALIIPKDKPPIIALDSKYGKRNPDIEAIQLAQREADIKHYETLLSR